MTIAMSTAIGSSSFEQHRTSHVVHQFYPGKSLYENPLIREQFQAMAQLCHVLPQWSNLVEPALTFQFVTTTGSFIFSESPFSRIPHGDFWTWNQSNKKILVEFETDECKHFSVILRKMNTRKRKGSPRAPSFKLWTYEISLKHVDSSSSPTHYHHQTIYPPSLYAIWCERGISNDLPKRPTLPPVHRTNHCLPRWIVDVCEACIMIPDTQIFEASSPSTPSMMAMQQIPHNTSCPFYK